MTEPFSVLVSLPAVLFVQLPPAILGNRVDCGLWTKRVITLQQLLGILGFVRIGACSLLYVWERWGLCGSGFLQTVWRLAELWDSEAVKYENLWRRGRQRRKLSGCVEWWSGGDPQSGALSLVESFIELKYFHTVATQALLCHKEPARRIQSPLPGSLWHKG